MEPYRLRFKDIKILWTGLFFITPVFGESLWLKSINQERSMFADATAFRKGDIVTVKIKEKVQNKQKDKALTTANHQAKYSFTQKLLDEVNRHGGPKITLPVPYEPVDDIEVETTVTMQVRDVLPNGNLVLEGVIRKRFFDNFQYQILRGTARPVDIAANNTIESSKLADFTMEHLTGTSPENARQDGIFSRLNNFVNPY